jgi:hypothetical protein
MAIPQLRCGVALGLLACISPDFQYYSRPRKIGVIMADLKIKAGGTVSVKITKHIGRESAQKTLERLFMKDKTLARPLAIRAKNFKDKPKRRGGRIWTKRPNKLHLELKQGTQATILATPQNIRDLNSVAAFI